MIKGVDYVGVGIGAVVVGNDGKILLAKRGIKARNEHGKWEFPGGGIEFGDTMANTIKRELKEELDIEIELLQHLPPIDHILPHENQHWVTSMFIAKITNGTPKIMEPEKCDAIGWFSLQELEQMIDQLSQPTRKDLPLLKKMDLKKV